METVLTTYALPYNPDRPVVCFDERPCFLIGNILQPIPMGKGQSLREDYTYSKHGSCVVMMALEPLTGKRWVKVYAQRTAKEYTMFMEYLEQQFRGKQITLVQDNLNTHCGGSFYKHLKPEQALKLKQRFDWVFTPKHASWLNMVELEFSVLSRQCLDCRIASMGLLESEVLAWVAERNRVGVKVVWQFGVEVAREKLGRHYQTIKI
jgi:DDE superfamily endonuclease